MSATELAVEATMDSVGTPRDVWASLSTEMNHRQKCVIPDPEHMSPMADLIQGPLPSAKAAATLEADVWSSFYIQGKGPFP